MTSDEQHPTDGTGGEPAQDAPAPPPGPRPGGEPEVHPDDEGSFGDDTDAGAGAGPTMPTRPRVTS